MFLAAQFSNLFTGGRSSREGYTEIFAAYLATFSRVELCESTLFFSTQAQGSWAK